MNLLSIPVIMMFSVCLYVGFYYLWLFLRRSDDYTNLYFAITSITIALYDLFCGGLYNADSIASGMIWQRYQFACLAVLSISISWFIYFFVEFKSKTLFYIITAWFSILFILGLTVHNELTLSIQNPMPKSVELGSLLKITYNEADPGLIYTVQFVSMLVGFIYILFLLIQNFKKGNKRETRPILLAWITFFIVCTNDILVGSGVYSFIYLVEYAYMFIILSMAFVLQNNFIELHYEVRELNRDLEKKVEERTGELNTAIKESEAINEKLINVNKFHEDAQKIAAIEMQMAVHVQTSIFPKDAPVTDEWDIAFYFSPLAGVSGDLYDFYTKHKRLEGVSLFDVSGHGLSSGLITLTSKSIISRYFSAMQKNSLNRVIEKINDEIKTELKNVDNYLSGVLLRFDNNNNIVEYVNACLLYTSPSPRDVEESRMPSSA